MGLPRRSIPSMAGLIAFEATARHLSFSRAAEDLSLSQGAVSKRVRQLEQVLGVPLLVRTTHQVCLTEVGRAYLVQVRKLLEQLESSTTALKTRARGRSAITLAVPPSFATRWLIPRLGQFHRRHPDILVNLTTRPGPYDFSVDGVSCAVHNGPCHWPDTATQHLFEAEYVPVSAPVLAKVHGWRKPADLAAAHHLQLTSRPGLWRAWFELADLPETTVHGPSLDRMVMIVEAALAGQGVALLPRFMIEEELEAGKLDVLCGGLTLVEKGYHFVLPARLASDPSVLAFAEWIAEEASRFAEQRPCRGPAVRLHTFAPARPEGVRMAALDGAKL